MSDDILKTAAGAAALIPVFGPAVSAALGIADALGAGSWLTEHVLGSSGTRVAEAVVQATAAATGGGTDRAAIIGLPPDKQAELRLQLAEIAAQQADAQRAADAAQRAAELEAMKAQLADIANARQRDQAFQASGKRNVRADVLLVAACCGMIACVIAAASGKVAADSAAMGMIISIGTMLVGCFKDAFSFEFGSSRSSETKTNLLAQSVPISAVASAALPFAVTSGAVP